MFQQQKRALHSICQGFFIWKWNAKNNDLNRKVSIIWKLKCSDFIFFMTTVWNIMRLLSPEMQDKRPINSQYVKVQQWFFNSCMQKKKKKCWNVRNTQMRYSRLSEATLEESIIECSEMAPKRPCIICIIYIRKNVCAPAFLLGVPDEFA